MNAATLFPAQMISISGLVIGNNRSGIIECLHVQIPSLRFCHIPLRAIGKPEARDRQMFGMHASGSDASEVAGAGHDIERAEKISAGHGNLQTIRLQNACVRGKLYEHHAAPDPG